MGSWKELGMKDFSEELFLLLYIIVAMSLLSKTSQRFNSKVKIP